MRLIVILALAFMASSEVCMETDYWKQIVMAGVTPSKLGDCSEVVTIINIAQATACPHLITPAVCTFAQTNCPSIACGVTFAAFNVDKAQKEKIVADVKDVLTTNKEELGQTLEKLKAVAGGAADKVAADAHRAVEAKQNHDKEGVHLAAKAIVHDIKDGVRQAGGLGSTRNIVLASAGDNVIADLKTVAGGTAEKVASDIHRAAEAKENHDKKGAHQAAKSIVHDIKDGIREAKGEDLVSAAKAAVEDVKERVFGAMATDSSASQLVEPKQRARAQPFMTLFMLFGIVGIIAVLGYKNHARGSYQYIVSRRYAEEL
jgi:hypothetical protein